MSPTAWLLIALDEGERQHAGNLGYRDEIGCAYRYDSKVPNARQLREGDIAILRSDRLLGVARIVRIDARAGTKMLQRCPTCGRTGLKTRTTQTPRYRCGPRHATFDQPRLTPVPVTLYDARFGDTFVPAPDAVDLAELRKACPAYNGQLVMQRIDLHPIVPAILARNPEAARVLEPDNLQAVGLPGANEIELAAEQAAAASEFDPGSVDDARRRISRTIALRQGQPGFRRALMTAYGGRCALTGCNAEPALEAAHIVPYRGANTHDVRNGVLLRADIHTLFDRGLLTIDSDRWVVVIDPALTGTDYASLAGKALRLPADPALRPSKVAVRSHRAASRL